MNGEGSNDKRTEARRRFASRIALKRNFGVPQLFAAGYATVGATVYVALGVIAGKALGLTPVLFFGLGVAFIVTLMIYMELSTLYPERGGSATFARYAFNELWSFVAGWAILLDYLIVIAVVALAVPHYLEAFSQGLTDLGPHLLISIAVIGLVSMMTIRGFSTGIRMRAARLAILDISLQLLIVIFGLALIANPDLITRGIDLGVTPSWTDLIYAAAIGTIAFTGIEAASNLAPEVRERRQSLKRVISASSVIVLSVYVGMSLVALMAVPVEVTAEGASTALGGQFLHAPVLAIAQSLPVAWIAGIFKYAVAVIGTLVLIQAANVAMSGIAGLSYSLATNRQLPKRLARLHPTHATPYVAVIIAALAVVILLIPTNLEMLLSIYAFGALLAITISNLSLVVLRFREPERRREFKVPLNLKVGRVEIPLLAIAGSVTAFLAWVSVIVYHEEARWTGLAWLVAGLVLYTTYRLSTGKSLTKRVTITEESLQETSDVAYGSILVPIFGTDLDDDIMGTAGRLAAEQKGDSEGSTIEAIYPIVVPITLPLNAKLPAQQMEQADRALAHAKEVGEEYKEVTVATSMIKTRAAGSAIVTEAKRREVEVIIVGGEKPSAVGGGQLLGGLAGMHTPHIGGVTDYILRRAECQVLLTAPPIETKETTQSTDA